jgi:hypothetical protein
MSDLYTILYTPPPPKKKKIKKRKRKKKAHIKIKTTEANGVIEISC